MRKINMEVRKRTERSFKWKTQPKNSSNLIFIISKSDNNIKKYEDLYNFVDSYKKK